MTSGKRVSKELDRVSAHPLFAGVSESVLRELMDGNEAEIKTFAAGELLLAENADPKAGLILSGKASVTTPDEGRSVLLRYLGSGDLFGIANLFSSDPFVSQIRATKPTKCFLLSEDGVKRLLRESEAFREHYVMFLGNRIRFLNRKIGYLTAGTAERRLALYLSSLGAGKVRLPISISDLSELLDIGRASLYRALDRLESDGYLTRSGKEWTLPDPAVLRHAYR